MSGYRILKAEKQGVFILKFIGEIRLNLCSTIDRAIEEIELSPDLVTVVVDLSQAEMVDSTTLGLIAKIGVFAGRSGKLMPTIITTNPDITRMIDTMGFDAIFVILNAADIQASDLKELPVCTASEEEVRQKVLAAHKVLMDLNDSNRETFKDLVQALECP
ncbi:MAG: STAS domain-containing protein [Hahellaceae bacterium]|nr:STAS domain-containing protein [Hahellaceae bacterium]